ncbi:RNA methyltransferase [Azospirillum sp. TSH64]|uniref:TrmH family RNA methyltransferase n=1 Tax=Azospirillum sp. TSH64 TaxID=652740 RepID=UPI000D60A26E|nr:RNA methyltransferase [Azospirillum sp. TSH64]PWC77557.1 RNA methyltransferase [Azospirillum sp. TSH64]
MTRLPLLIESPQNPQFKLWESALESRGLKKNGKFLLAGLKTVPEALRQHPARFERVLFTDPAQIASWRLPAGVEPVQLAPALFRMLDVSGTGFPLLVGAVPKMPAIDLSQQPQGLELLCALGDPSNLGALLRSAAAFGVSRIVLLEGAAHPFHPKCLRAASNAQFTLTMLRGPRWTAVNEAAGPLYALDGGGEDLTRFDWPADMRLILGEEGQGVPADCPATRLSVPTTGAVESLNATVAVSVALFARYAAAKG